MSGKTCGEYGGINGGGKPCGNPAGSGTDHLGRGRCEHHPARGRPTVYTDEIADEILARLSAGETLRHICRDDHLPSESTVRGWDVDDREGFSARYARARADLIEHWADEIVAIADTEQDAAKARVRVDTRKWLMSKLRPQQYGDRQTIAYEGDLPAIRVTVDE